MKVFFTKARGWEVDFTIAKRRIREHGFTTKKAAEDFVAELRVQAKRGKFGLERDHYQVTVASLVQARSADIGESTTTSRLAIKILKSFLRSLPPGLSVFDLRAAHLNDWSRELRRRGFRGGPLKANSCNRYLAEVSVMLKEAPSYFAQLHDWRPPPFPWQKDSGRGRERVISDEEAKLLLEHLRFPPGRKNGKALRARDVAIRRDVADCFELGLLTGMRGGEIRRLEWSEVFLEEAEIHLPAHKTKTRTPRVVMLNARAVEIFRRRRNASARLGGWIFPNPAGTRPRRDISFVIRPIAIQLGLRYGANIPDGFTPHSTRHTATTKMLRAGFDLKTVQDIVGHSDNVMSLRYSHSTAESRRQAVEILGQTAKRSGSKASPRQKVDKQTT
mgnify:CR=1 FL=1